MKEMNMNDALKAYFDKEGVNFKATEIDEDVIKKAKRFEKYLRNKGLVAEFMREMSKESEVHYGSIEDYAISQLMKGREEEELLDAFDWEKAERGFYFWGELSVKWEAYLDRLSCPCSSR